MTEYPTFRLTPWVKRLLIANAVVFFVQKTVFTGIRGRSDNTFTTLFGFAPDRLLEHPWSPFTYAFVHEGFFQLAFVLLMLLVFAPAVEHRLGSPRFLRLFAISAMGAVGLKLVIAAVAGTSASTVVGGSAAVFGVALAFAWMWPDIPFRVFPFTAPVNATWVVAILAAVNFVVLVAARTPGLDPFPHLGGLVAAYLFLRVHLRPPEQPMEAVHRLSTAKVLVPERRQHAEADRQELDVPDTPTPAQRRAEIDRVLDKISESGIDSLTPAERRLLEDAGRDGST